MVLDSKDLDVVILGASGFTGKYVIREFLECMANPRDPKEAHIKLALAGRSVSKLKAALQWAVDTSSANSDVRDVAATSNVTLLSADCNDVEVLATLCGRTRVVVGCVGPFNVLGPPIVAACVAAGTHYVDISGEAEFMERMEVAFHEEAVKNKALIVPSCASVSLLSDIGLLWHLRQWPMSWIPALVHSYARLIDFPTYHAASAETAFQAFANAHQLAQFRRQAPKRPRLQIPNQPHLGGDKTIQYFSPLGHWTSPLPISDRAVVRRTFWTLHQQYPHGPRMLDESPFTIEQRYELWAPVRPVIYKNFMCFHNFKWAFAFKWAIRVITFIAPYKLGQKLLFKYPRIFTVGVFTKKGPSFNAIKSARFELWFFGHGCDSKDDRDVEIVTKMEGPEPCYVASAIGVVQATFLCLHSRKALPIGGVLTTSIAFGNSDIIQRLKHRGITFTHVGNNHSFAQSKAKEKSTNTSIFGSNSLFSWISIFVFILLSIYTFGLTKETF